MDDRTPERLKQQASGGDEQWLAEHLRKMEHGSPAISQRRATEIERELFRPPSLSAAVVVLALGLGFALKQNRLSPALASVAHSTLLFEDPQFRVERLSPSVEATQVEGHMNVSNGRVLVTTQSAALSIDVPDGRLVVRPQSKVLVEVTDGHTKVATYGGVGGFDWQSGHDLPLVAAAASPTIPTESSMPNESSRRNSKLQGKIDAPQPKQKRAMEEIPRPASDSKESSISAESRLLHSAITELREKSNPSAALEAVARYHTQFPQGMLRPEAERIEVDALLKQGKRSDALGRLEKMKFDAKRDAGFTVLRGELRLESGRYPQAIEDFSSAAEVATGDLAERALFGRGQAWAKAGDLTKARADLERYLNRFPSGKFADSARRSLNK